jgi:hypothetical protein
MVRKPLSETCADRAGNFLEFIYNHEETGLKRAVGIV